MRVTALLAAAAAGALAMYLYDRQARGAPQPVTDPSIPPSESSATRLRDKPGYAQEDADQE